MIGIIEGMQSLGEKVICRLNPLGDTEGQKRADVFNRRINSAMALQNALNLLPRFKEMPKWMRVATPITIGAVGLLPACTREVQQATPESQFISYLASRNITPINFRPMSFPNDKETNPNDVTDNAKTISLATYFTSEGLQVLTFMNGQIVSTPCELIPIGKELNKIDKLVLVVPGEVAGVNTELFALVELVFSQTLTQEELRNLTKLSPEDMLAKIKQVTAVNLDGKSGVTIKLQPSTSLTDQVKTTIQLLLGGVTAQEPKETATSQPTNTAIPTKPPPASTEPPATNTPERSKSPTQEPPPPIPTETPTTQPTPTEVSPAISTEYQIRNDGSTAFLRKDGKWQEIPAIQGLKPLIEEVAGFKTIVYRAEAGNKWGFEIGERVGAVDPNQYELNLDEQMEQVGGFGLHPKIAANILWDNGFPNNIVVCSFVDSTTSWNQDAAIASDVILQTSQNTAKTSSHSKNVFVMAPAGSTLTVPVDKISAQTKLISSATNQSWGGSTIEIGQNGVFNNLGLVIYFHKILGSLSLDDLALGNALATFEAGSFPQSALDIYIKYRSPPPVPGINAALNIQSLYTNKDGSFTYASITTKNIVRSGKSFVFSLSSKSPVIEK